MAQDDFKPQDTSSNETRRFDKDLNKNVSDFHLAENEWVHARNAINNSKTGDLGKLGNEPANKWCIQAPYTIMGFIHLEHDKWVICSTDEINSEIGYFQESTCTYATIVNDPCLNFSTKNLITGVSRELFDCNYAIYFADQGRNPDRYLKIGDIRYAPFPQPWPGIPYITEDVDPTAECFDEQPLAPYRLICDSTRLETLMRPICLHVSKSASGGELLNGSYFATAAYSIDGQIVTDYFTPSNIQPLFDHSGIGGSLEISVEGIDNYHFDQFELVIISIINQQTVARRLGFYSTNQRNITIDILDQSLVSIPLGNIPVKNVIYDRSDAMYKVNDYLLRVGPTSRFDINYQPLANQIVAKWQSIEYPETYYKDGGNKTGYMRDEVYPFFIRWVYNTGDRTASFHIPGRPPFTDIDHINGLPLSGSPHTDKDVNIAVGDDNIDEGLGITSPQLWQQYNTAQSIPPAPNTVLCDGGVVIAQGYMGYWESSEIYPDKKPEIWNASYHSWSQLTSFPYSNTMNGLGDYDLCGKFIRHHRFPDNALIPEVSHFRPNKTNASDTEFIRIMGVAFENIRPPVDNDGVLIPGIIGYEILRGSRKGNKSVIAKGIINNMVTFPIEGQNNKIGLFQNYPYNDLQGDRFLSRTKTRWSGTSFKDYKPYESSQYFTNDAENKSNLFSFHSPETNFSNPYLAASELKVYMDLFGIATMKYQYPAKHPRHIFIKDIALIMAIIGGTGLGVLATKGRRVKNMKGAKSANSSWFVAGFTNGTQPGPGAAVWLAANGIYSAGLTASLVVNGIAPVAFLEAIAGANTSSDSTNLTLTTTGIGTQAAAVAGGGEAGYIDYEQEFGQNDYTPVTLNVLSTVMTGLPTFIYYLSQGADEIVRTITNFAKPQQHALQAISHCLYNDYGNTTYSLPRSLGETRRLIGNQAYIDNQIHDFGNTYKVNNLYRGRYVLLELGYSPGQTGVENSMLAPPVIQDLTRYNTRLADLTSLSSNIYKNPEVSFTKQSSTYYVALKQKLRNQYGQLESIVQIPTGCMIAVCPASVQRGQAYIFNPDFSGRLAALSAFTCDGNNVIVNPSFENAGTPSLNGWTSDPTGFWIPSTFGGKPVAKSGATLSSATGNSLKQIFTIPPPLYSSWKFSFTVDDMPSGYQVNVYFGSTATVPQYIATGVGTFTNSSPLVINASPVVDCIRFESQGSFDSYLSTAQFSASNLDNLNGGLAVQFGFSSVSNNPDGYILSGGNTVYLNPDNQTDFSQPGSYISNLSCTTRVNYSITFNARRYNNGQVGWFYLAWRKYDASIPIGDYGFTLPGGIVTFPLTTVSIPPINPYLIPSGIGTGTLTVTGSVIISNPDPGDTYALMLVGNNLEFGLTSDLSVEFCLDQLPISISDVCFYDLGIPPGVVGCMDPNADNFDPLAEIPCDECCIISGCTDPSALNYNPNATVSNNSCIYPGDPGAVQITGSCDPPCLPYQLTPPLYRSGVIFGGDIYVGRYTEKNSFFYFTDWLYGQLDRTEFDYLKVRNIPYPTYWFDSAGFSVSESVQSIWTTITNPANWGDIPKNLINPSDFHVFDRENNPLAGGLVIKRAYIYLFNSGVRDFFVESEYNLALRDFGDPVQERHYEAIGRDSFTDLPAMFESGIIRFGNYYKYDTSLSIAKMWYSAISWGAMHPNYYDPNVAETCYQYRPDRIIYSLPAEGQIVRDNWQIFLTNNYKDFLSRVIAVKQINKSGALILFESDSPVMFQGTDQLQTELGTKLTIGDGGLFSQPMQSPMNADRPFEYGSCQNRLSVINTPIGTFWLNQNQGKIFQFADGLTEISMGNLKWWLAQYMPYQLTKYYPTYNLTDNPVAGIGCQIMYDNTNNLLYFTKKDYKPVLDATGKPIAEYNPDTQEFYVTIGIRPNVINVKVSIDDTRYFQKASWTLSFDPKQKGYVSWHDWHPDLMIPGKNTFMTVSKVGQIPTVSRPEDKANSVWIHNERCDLYANYYGFDFPFEVEYMVNTAQTVNTLRSIEYQLEVYRYKFEQNCYDRFHVLDYNFDEAVIYNTEQCSGLLKLNITPKNNPGLMLAYPQVTATNIQILYSKEENKYRFNQFWDTTSNRGEFPLGSTYPPIGAVVPGTTVLAGTLAQRTIWDTEPNGYIKNLNANNLDYAKSQLERKKFRHYTSSVFLRRKVSGDKKMLISLASNKNLYSPR
jgi:hypothetical protein